MKKLLSVIFLTGVLTMVCGYEKQKVQKTEFPAQEEILSRLKKYPYKPYFPPASNRKEWNKLPESIRKELISRAESDMKKPWPLLTARQYMEFKRKGDRRSYEKPYFLKRNKLISMVIGECCEYSGRFIDEIVEGIWQILSEPAWCLPAHEWLPPDDPLPDPTRFQVDLFNASTGKILTDVLELLEPELTKVSPALVKRLKMELMRRIIEPAEKLNDKNTWWFSGYNNWTPWCASNLNGSAIYLLNDQPKRQAEFLHKYLTIIRRFYEKYPGDGGCNEGPSYWNHSVGKYVQHLDMIDHRLHLGGKMFRDEKLRRMCEYPAGMNLFGKEFLSVSDSVKNVKISSEFLKYLSCRINSPLLMSMARRMEGAALGRSGELDYYLIYIFAAANAGKPVKDVFSAVNFWQNMGLVILRENTESPEKGTIVSLKGGHNGESHNHNDLGNVVLVRKGKTLLADVGVGVYTAQTFSAQRYDIWNLGAQGHNAPRFSGVTQEFGENYKSVLTLSGDSAAAVDLSKAYPVSAGVKKLNRVLTLDRQTGAVEIVDTAEVSGKKKVEISLYTAVSPDSFTASELKWKQGTLKVSGLKIAEVSEEVRLDSKLKKTWGRLWRIELVGEIEKSGNWKLNFDFKKITK